MKPTKPHTHTTPAEFFREFAGYSWNPSKGETPAQGRERCAQALADAEAQGTAAGLTAEWREDPDADTSFLKTRSEKENARFFYCEVRSADGEVRASLHGIHEDSRDELGARYYRRVVRAELFAEALAEVQS